MKSWYLQDVDQRCFILDLHLVFSIRYWRWHDIHEVRLHLQSATCPLDRVCVGSRKNALNFNIVRAELSTPTVYMSILIHTRTSILRHPVHHQLNFWFIELFFHRPLNLWWFKVNLFYDVYCNFFQYNLCVFYRASLLTLSVVWVESVDYSVTHSSTIEFTSRQSMKLLNDDNDTCIDNIGKAFDASEHDIEDFLKKILEFEVYLVMSVTARDYVGFWKWYVEWLIDKMVLYITKYRWIIWQFEMFYMQSMMNLKESVIRHVYTSVHVHISQSWRDQQIMYNER